MRRLLSFALVATPLATSGAQSILDGGLRAAPQFTSYTIRQPIDEKITEFTVPMFAVIPMGSRLVLDVGSAYASAHASIAGQESNVNGMTDTQLRANYTLGTDFLVLTVGANLPTGRSRVAPLEQAAALRIGSDFLAFPITSLGTGLGLTGGFAIAQPVGSWNVGLGASLRRTSSYEPFDDGAGTTAHYQPGNEYRARLGVDHPVGTGRLALGVTYSAFGNDAWNGSLYNTGNRVIGQASVGSAVGPAELTVAAWDVYRASGTLYDQSPLGSDNIANVYVAAGVRPFGAWLEPSVEARNWQQQGQLPSTMFRAGLRTRLSLGPLAVFPSGSYAMGKINGAAGMSELTGWQAALTARLGGF